MGERMHGPTAADLDAIDAGYLPGQQLIAFEQLPELDPVAVIVELHQLIVELRRAIDLLERPSPAVASLTHMMGR